MGVVVNYEGGDMTEKEERMLEAIFKDIPTTLSDCDTCPYEEECRKDNPDFDANGCLVNS